jgi:mono/diheme cytochrome c family protein
MSYSAPVTVTQYAADAVDRGKQLYTSKQCLSCHGTTNGPDFHSPTVQGSLSDDQLIRTINEGYSNRTNKVMSFHAWMVGPDDALRIVAYLRTLPLRGWPKPDDEFR